MSLSMDPSSVTTGTRYLNTKRTIEIEKNKVKATTLKSKTLLSKGRKNKHVKALPRGTIRPSGNEI